MRDKDIVSSRNLLAFTSNSKGAKITVGVDYETGQKVARAMAGTEKGMSTFVELLVFNFDQYQEIAEEATTRDADLVSAIQLALRDLNNNETGLAVVRLEEALSKHNQQNSQS